MNQIPLTKFMLNKRTEGLIAAHQQGDSTKAAELQALAVRMINAFLECGAHPIAAFKWFMSRVAVECGPVRLPLANPSPEQIAALETTLEASGVFEWVNRRPATTVAACA